MKLMIDISEKEINECKENYALCVKYEVKPKAYEKMIANAIPFDSVIEDIKAEIDKLHKVGNADDGRVYVPINDVFDVIDKHIGKAESEK